MPYPQQTQIKIRGRSIQTIHALKSPKPIKDSFHSLLDQVQSELGLILLMYSGQRSYAEQWELRKKYLAGGKRAATPAGSWHPFGRAVDVIPVFYDGTPNWALPDSVWAQIEKIGNRYGLTSGRSFNDPGHFKNMQGATLVKLRRANPGWEQYAEAEKKLSSPIKKVIMALTPAEGNKWIKPVVYTGLAGLTIYGIFELTKTRR